MPTLFVEPFCTHVPFLKMPSQLGENGAIVHNGLPNPNINGLGKYDPIYLGQD